MHQRYLTLYRAYSISFNSSNVGKLFWSWILTDCIKVQEKKRKESCCLVFPSSTRREIRHFHVVVVQRRQRNVQKRVMHVSSCCFANLNLLLFRRSRSRHRRLLLKLPIKVQQILYLGNKFERFLRSHLRHCDHAVGIWCSSFLHKRIHFVQEIPSFSSNLIYTS